MEKMTNRNTIQCVTQKTSLSGMIGRSSLDSAGGMIGILKMLPILISGLQTTTKITTQLRDTNKENGQGKTTNMHFIVI